MSAGRDGDVLLYNNSRPAPAGWQEQLLIRYSLLLPDSHETCAPRSFCPRFSLSFVSHFH